MSDILSQKLKEQVRRAGNQALDLLFPPRCVGCNRIGQLVCAECRRSLQPLSDTVCEICCESLLEPGRCARCRKHRPYYHQVHAAYHYVGVLRDMIHALKYGGQRRIAVLIADLVHDVFSDPPMNPDLVVAVPMYETALSQREFNHAQLLAAELNIRWGLAKPDEDVLIRVRQTERQVGKDFASRQKNVYGAFRASSAVSNQRVLIVDDVCTTGATLDACAFALLEAGADIVECVTAARAGRVDILSN